MKRGFITGLGLVLVGMALQASVGFVDWSLMAWPVNVIVLALIVVSVITAHLAGWRTSWLQRLNGAPMAVAALCWTTALTLLMGLVRQGGADADTHHTLVQLLGIDRCLSWWPFVLAYLWLTIVLLLVILRRLVRFSIHRDGAFMLNHLGLVMVLLCATLGSVDMQRMQMTTVRDRPEWRATDERGQLRELPIAIQLLDFTIDEYPPKLYVIDNATESPLPAGKPQTLLLDSAFTRGTLQGHDIMLLQVLDKAQPVMAADSTRYEPWEAVGACTAAQVMVDGVTHWLSTGSHMLPPQGARLDEATSLVMPTREPRRYVSTVEIMTESGKHLKADVMVNKPVKVEGWKIYQLNYDTSMGRWSDTSVLELVRDPWLPAVYIGIGMMLAGAVMMLLTPPRRKERDA